MWRESHIFLGAGVARDRLSLAVVSSKDSVVGRLQLPVAELQPGVARLEGRGARHPAGGLDSSRWRARGRAVLSPEGVAHRDRAAALQHLAHELSREVYSRGEVAALRACLAADGWQFHTMLPEGQKVRRTDGRPPQFLTRAGLCWRPTSRPCCSEQRNLKEREASLGHRESYRYA